MKGVPARTASNDPPDLADLLDRATNSRAPGAVADTGKKPKREAHAAAAATAPQASGA